MKKTGQTNYVRYGELSRIKGVTTIIKADVAGKQDKLTEAQMAAVNSGITAETISLMSKLLTWFGEDENGDIYVIPKADDSARNFYSYGNVSAGGNGGGGQGGGGVLYALNDIYHSDTSVLRADGTEKQSGDALVYNNTLGKWVAAAQSGGASVSWGTASAGTQVLTVDGVSKTLLTAHQSLSAYRTAANQDTIDNAIIARLGDTTSSNPAADKAFVNSSIATSTATFRGTSASGLTEAQFLAWANGLTKDNNDYVFWNTVDSAGNTQYKRYKYNGSSWEFEYTLNNSTFTAAQWAAIGSGVTSALVTKLNGIATGAQVNVIESVKLNGTVLTVTSKAVNINAATSLSMPTGLSAAALTSAGNIAVSFQSGYSIPTTIKQTSWDSGLATLASLKSWIESLFVKEGSGTTADPYRIKANYDFYSVGNVSAGGNGGGGQGGGGTLYALTDVKSANNVIQRLSGGDVQTGDLFFKGDSSHWYALAKGSDGQILSMDGGMPKWIAAPATGVTTFNNRSGAVTLSSTDVTSALGYTPYNAANIGSASVAYATNAGTVNGYAADNLYKIYGIRSTASQSVDCNNITNAIQTDYRWINAAENTIGGVIDITYSPDWRMQLFSRMDAACALYIRNRYNGNNWTEWKRLALVSDIPTNNNQLTNGAGYITGITKAMVDAVGANADTLDGQHGSYYATASSLGNYLPLSGGTINATDIGSFNIYRNNATYSCVHFFGLVNSVKTDLGYLGFNGVSSPVFINSGGTPYNLYHSGNLTKATLGLGNVDNTADANKIVARANYADVLRDPSYHDASHRRTSANITWTDAGLHYYLATSSMTEGKPSADGHILHMSWDNGSWEGQMNIPTAAENSPQWRTMNGGTWSSWMTFYHSGNSNNTSTPWTCSNLTASGNATISGNVGIGTTSPSEKLHVAGNVLATGNVTAGSDRRWKHNISPVINGIDTIMRLQPSTWVWNEDHGGKDGAGLIAQDVQSVVPYAVVGDEKSGLTLNYNIFHAFEISALQNHETRIEALERENAELRRQIARLTS